MPSWEMQKKLILTASKQSGVDLADVQYVEMHGKNNEKNYYGYKFLNLLIRVEFQGYYIRTSGIDSPLFALILLSSRQN